MASGGHSGKNPKASASEPRQRRSWQRTTSASDKDDNISQRSFSNDLKPNNWDFSDWRPTGSQDQTKRRKKGNPEWEREQSLTQESPPPSERQHGTPRTYPRTKVTPSTPTSQRLALENLRQHMTFSDQEDGVSNDGERESNNDRNLLRRRENLAGSNNRAESNGLPEGGLSRPVPNRQDRNNRNNNKQNHNDARNAAALVKPDSSQIVGRLMQIRDYIKQTSSMMDSLNKSGDTDSQKKVDDFTKLIKSLKNNEAEYLQILQVLWPGYRNEMDRLEKLMDHLKEQERGYTGLLQTILSVRDEPDVNDANREMTPNLDNMDDTTSVDLDVQSEVSEREERSVSASSRPRIEDKLGLTSDNDEDEALEEVEAPSESSDNSDTMDDTVVANRLNQAWDFEGDNELGIDGVQNPREAVETLLALRQQQELLQKLVEQQEQMRALRGRQAALLALQQDAEAKLASTRQKGNESRTVANDLDDLAATMSRRVESLSESNAGRPADPELLDIRQQLQYLRNELKTQDRNQQTVQPAQRNQPRNQQQQNSLDAARPKNVPPPRPPSPKLDQRQTGGKGRGTKQTQGATSLPSPANRGAALPSNLGATSLPTNLMPSTEMSKEQIHSRLQELMDKKNRLDQLLQEEFLSPVGRTNTEDMSRDQLVDKLNELQNKKRRMDDMLKELHNLRANPSLMLNNALTVGGGGPVQATDDIDPVEAATGGSENLASNATELLEARQKLQKLTEVKSQINQLKSLVQGYQDSSMSGGRGKPGDTIEDPAALHAALQAGLQGLQAFSDFGTDGEVTRDRGPDRESGAMYRKPHVNIPVKPVDQEDSDENNSSSSEDTESESQLSSLGPWGDDPDIQEKVRKLKEAKEKLKNLQNLVALVQAPGMSEGLPDSLLELAAGMDDVADIDDEEQDTHNASVSEGEIPQMSDRDGYYQAKMKEQMVELDELKNEKTRLLNIQSQLQTLHDRYQQAEAQRDQQKEAATQEESRSKSPQLEEDTNQQQDHSSQQNTGPSVTFSSNEEVYYKMRNQRMLREELREKKKQLESIMKKDRNRKQYYKNQDNQSDTVSYSTEVFGASASVDQTMATWGGSTVDNMESITEDGAAQDNDEDEDEDDAYPIDGILQVEEEEEENQSDNETYTIEDDVRQSRKARGATGGMEKGRKGGKRSYPRPSGRHGGARPKEVWTRPTDFSKWSRNGRRSRQEVGNYRSAEDIVQDDEVDSRGGNKTAVEELQMKVEEMSKLCQSLLEEKQQQQQPLTSLARQTSAGFGSHSQLTSELQQQLQQQQLMMSLNQCYQQFSLQQMEMQAMQRQIQALLYQQSENPDESAFSPDPRSRSMPSLFSPMLPRQSPNLLFPEAFQFNPMYGHVSPGNQQQRLLRRAVDSETGADNLAESGTRQRRTSRQSRSDSYRGKKKSQSPSQLNNNTQVRNKPPATQLYQADADDDEATNQYTPDRQKFEDYLAKKKKEFIERNKLQDRSQKQFQASGRGSMSSLGGSGEDGQMYRPGLSAGISGAGYAEDGRSIVSSIQSSVAAVSQANQPDTQADRDSDDPAEMSLFETLRETIYSEVATLISQNESRPHYLIELFRELQLLTTDYLRQRVLYDIKEIVSKYLVDENTAIAAPTPPWMNSTAAANNFTTSELTPSESIVTSDDEEVKCLLQTRLKQKVAANLVAKERQRTAQLLRAGSLSNEKYDYQEQAEVDSTVSTPSNWESPFNRDSLGETAINLEKTLKKMREYEEKLAVKNERVKALAEARTTDTEGMSSSAMDQGDESSVNSDSVPYPRIDTQQLDQQIKAIMTEVIPVIKEHMDNMCSPQLLAYIKRLVLSLTRQYDGGQEFARFFHRQLGSILQDTLAKYEGRKMRECGEDLLVDMSEVLFNELAFFRLMQDLDDPLIAEKMKKAGEVAMQGEEDEDDDDELEKIDNSDNETDTTESSVPNASDNQDETRPTQTEEEDLGKARDDELANEAEIQDADDKDDDPESPFKAVQIQLAPSETKPYTRIGSDEDDESATDESQSNEDPSETAVSIDARRKYNDAGLPNTTDRQDATRQDGLQADGVRQEGVRTDSSGQDGSRDSGTAEVDNEKQTGGANDGNRDADQGASNGKTDEEHMNGDILNGDIEVITMDDLPASLTVMSSEELQGKIGQEQEGSTGAAAVLGMMEGQEELAGDPFHLKQPDEASG